MTSTVKQLLRGKHISSTGPYADLYTVREEPEPFISFEDSILKINMKPIEAGFKRLREIFSFYNNKTFAVVLVLIGLFVFWGVRKVDPRLQMSRAHQAVGLVK